jgi:glycosyltransferase involved in cell wall biosynthesis
MLGNFINIGADVTLVSSTIHTEQPWSDNSISHLKRKGIKQVKVFKPDRKSRAVDRSIGRIEKKIVRNLNSIYTEIECSLSYRIWFRRVVDRANPDLIVINYAWFDQLMRHDRWQGIQRHIETHDVVTITKFYREKACDLLAAREAGAPPHEVYNVKLMDELTLPNIDTEIEIFDRYNNTIVVSEADQNLLFSRLSKSRVCLIPIGERPRQLNNEYRDGILLAMGPNPFNRLALGFFCEIVWPLVRRLVPKASAYITGSVAPPCTLPEGIVNLGFVDDLRPLFENVKFAISPVFLGTGQQVKIVEFLSCGLGVVALDVATVSPLLRHGVNGMITRSAEEMAAAIADLYQNRALCMSYGKAGRDLIALDSVENAGFLSTFLT